MSINKILAKIETDTAAQIEAMRAENDEKIRDIEKDAAEFASKTENEAREKAKIEAERRFDQLLARREAELRVELLARKRRLVAEAFTKGEEAAGELPDEKLRDIFSNLILSIGEKEGRIEVGSREEALKNQAFAELLEEKIASSKFEFAVSDKFARGLMLFAGKIQYDMRFDRLFAELEENLTDKIAAILFAENEVKPK